VRTAVVTFPGIVSVAFAPLSVAAKCRLPKQEPAAALRQRALPFRRQPDVHPCYFRRSFRGTPVLFLLSFSYRLPSASKTAALLFLIVLRTVAPTASIVCCSLVLTISVLFVLRYSLWSTHSRTH